MSGGTTAASSPAGSTTAATRPPPSSRTTFKVKTAEDRQGVYPPGTITATGGTTGTEALVDGDYLTYWDAKQQIPASLTLDLGEVRKARYLAVNQREWSPTHNRGAFGRKEDSTRIKDYRVQVSIDGDTWKQVKAGVLESAKGVRFIDLGNLKTRHIRLDIDSTWGSPTVPSFYNKLAIDELYVGWRHPVRHSN
ncbi:discoidin domain-containing protein [Nonomuraea lactucae]|uniref:discoidin domain-containing protein n=1 Tax=Nonomuraea lactucae TaxID=2249762 RepID=UPI000DE515DF|nr:discoidin domain-containing protein [Nonomuraea lactucae]